MIPYRPIRAALRWSKWYNRGVRPSPRSLRRRLIWPAMLPLLAWACAPRARDLRESFPLGLYGVRASEMAEISKAGFDAALPLAENPGEWDAAAGQARRHGVRLVADYRLLGGGKRSKPGSWPILAWYLQDEPDVHRIGAEDLARRAAETRAADPRPQTFVVGSASGAAPYAAIGDALMLDWYPVPHLPLDGVADQVDEALRLLPAGKPLWMVVQAFDWRDDAQRDPNRPRIGRFPSFEEIRFMSYLSVLHGARGLFFYRFNQVGDLQGKSLLDLPERWQALERVAREFSALRPVFLKGAPAHIPFRPNPDGLEARAWRHRGRDYLILLNRKKGFHQRVPDEVFREDWRPLFEPRRELRELLKPIGPNWFLPPYRVLVLESPRRRGTPAPKAW